MNPYLCRVVLRPRNPFEVFDLAFRFLQVHWRPLVTLGSWLLLVPWALLSVGSLVTGGSLLWAAVPILFAPVLQVPFTVLAARLLFQDEVRPGAALRESLRLAGPWAAAVALRGLVYAISAVPCGMLLPPAHVGALFQLESALLERVEPTRALRRSFLLATSEPIAVITAGLGSWCVVLWCALVGEAAGAVLTNSVLQIGTPFGTVLQGWATPWLLGGLLLAHPIVAIYRLMAYVDVRTRLEGWDLQVRLRAIGLAA